MGSRSRRSLLALALLTTTACGAVPGGTSALGPEATPAAAGDPSGGRLSRTVVPLSYELDLTIVPAAPGYGGAVTIDIRIAEPTRAVWLHGDGLTVTKAAVRHGDRETPATWTAADDGFARLDLAAEVPAGDAAIHIEYRASYRNSLDGLYRIEANGEAYAFTQFEPLAARQAFPCFDEPSFKTPFDVSVRVLADHVAIGNTREVAVGALADGMKRVQFATTEPMPTYLIAWAVGPLDVVEAAPIAANPVRATPVPLRGVAIRGRGEELAYALTHTPDALSTLETYFGTPYPYDKLDIIAVPDFEAGAMENVGAVMFRDTALLIDEDSASARQLRGFAYTMVHELAHQWFGNLVTMSWWDDLWLNEGFASWMEGRAMAEWRPEYSPELDQLEWVLDVMDADSLTSARQIRQPITTPHDIHNAFDGITYGKGAGVLGMFEHYLGPSAFRRGVQDYLAAHRMGNATTEDLLAALDGTGEVGHPSAEATRDGATAMAPSTTHAETAPSIAGPFASFLMQPGVPLVSAALSCDENGNVLALGQQRYLPLQSTVQRSAVQPSAVQPSAVQPSATATTPGAAGTSAGMAIDSTRAAPIWQIPVCVRYESAGELHTQCTLLTEAQATMRLDTEACPTWVMPNADGLGYYRWILPANDLDALRRRGYTRLSSAERLSFADSLQAAFASGALGPDAILPMLSTFTADRARAVAVEPLEILRWVHRYGLGDERRATKLGQLVDDLYGDRYRRLGVATRVDDSDDQRLLRVSVVEALALIAERPDVLRELSTAVEGRLASSPESTGATSWPTDLMEVALVASARHAIEPAATDLFDRMEARLHAATDGIERRQLLHGLGSFRVSVLAERARRLTFDERLRGNERLEALKAQLDDAALADDALSFTTEHLGELVAALPAGHAGYMPKLFGGLCTTAARDRLQQAFGPRAAQLPGAPRNLASAMEQIGQCTARRAHHQAAFDRFFR